MQFTEVTAQAEVLKASRFIHHSTVKLKVCKTAKLLSNEHVVKPCL